MRFCYKKRMPRTVASFCRICEAHCGVEITVKDDHRVVQVRPDRSHPVSRGYACLKGAALGELHHDPDRLDVPLKRTPSGWRRISWQQALAEIGAKVRGLRSQHGNRSIGMYTGNPTFFSLQSALYSHAFLEALGSPNLFASHSIDVNNKLYVATKMYGLSMIQPVPDFENLRLFVCLGSNPIVSQMSVVQLPHSLAALKGIEQRGGRVVFVDPRRHETAQKVGEHIAIRPGTDAYLLLAMLHVIAIEGTMRPKTGHPPIDRVANGLDDFVEAARPYTPERVAELTGISATVIRELATSFANADGAALYMSTGVNMGPFGSIAYWVLQGLNLLTGNLDRRGGLLVPKGPFDVLALVRKLGLGGEDEHRTRASGLSRVAGAFPAAALAEEIQHNAPDRIRGLFVSAGNPLHSIPGNDLSDALESLELLVVIDLYRNETAAHADYLLPATDMLERSDYPISWAVLQPHPHAQFTPAVVPPASERREEWRIFSDLALACGAPLLGIRGFGPNLLSIVPRLNRLLHSTRWEITPDHLLALLLRWGRKVTLKQLREVPRGILLEPTEPGSFLPQRVATEDGKIQLAPPELIADLDRLASWAKERAAEDRGAEREDQLLLIGRRERRSHNSWLHNLPAMRPKASPQAWIHPEDAARGGLHDGDAIVVTGNGTAMRAVARVTENIARGVVSVPHGWGHRGSGWRQASQLGGDNVNRVIPGGVEHIERVSGQAIMQAHRVSVSPAAADALNPEVSPGPNVPRHANTSPG